MAMEGPVNESKANKLVKELVLTGRYQVVGCTASKKGATLYSKQFEGKSASVSLSLNKNWSQEVLPHPLQHYKPSDVFNSDQIQNSLRENLLLFH